MAQPTRFTITVDFSDEELNGVVGRSEIRTAMLDSLFAALQETTDEICDNLALIQRDDAELADGVVKVHTLSSDVRTLIASGSFEVQGDWVTATEYALGDIVIRSGVVYLCTEAHTSDDFATDLAAEKWGPITFVQVASDTPFSATTTLDSTNVQAAIAEVDGDFRGALSILKQQLFNGL